VKQIAHYTIIEKIGEGGMGEVFRARDDRLKREVAVKLLPNAFVQDPERLARFEREAQVLASLQHPNVASIFGLEQDGSRRFLALELVPGEDLARRLESGAVPVDETLAIAGQIAAAMEAAHELGIVHRDLKPSNVMLTPDGEAKVLDFGLAKAVEGELSDSSLDLSRSPTVTGLMTEANVVLGTAPYMSPEQARGKKVDKRSDIWAFGVIVFEMLTGERLFDGETVSDTLASVLKTDPDWERLPAGTPQHLRSLLRRCLTRDPRNRLRDIGEARIVLERGEEGAPSRGAVGAGGFRLPVVLATAALCVAIGVVLAWLLKPAPAEPEAGLPMILPLEAGPGDEAPTDPAISPDGARVAYIRNGSIWVRELGTLEPRHLSRTENVLEIFWSPDGDRIGYLTSDRVMTVDPVDGNPVVVAPTGSPITDNSGGGGTWSREHGILFARGRDHVFRVSDRGGDATVYAPADTSREIDLHEPSLLPDGGILVVPHARGEEGLSRLEIVYGDERVQVASTPQSRVYRPVWSQTGHILYERRQGNPGIWAVPWDLEGRRAAGEQFLVFPNGVYPSVSNDGTLVLLQGSTSRHLQLVESNRDGKVLRRIGEPGRYSHNLSLAPDGNRLALVRSEEGSDDIWVHDLARGTDSRLTFFRGTKRHPQWSPDGGLMSYYTGNSAASLLVMVQPTDGSAGMDTVAARTAGTSFVPGTENMLFSTYSDDTSFDIYLGPRNRSGERRALTTEGNWEYAPVASPDGRYVAYVSRETGQDQVFLKRLPDGSGKWQVSIEGGGWPKWNAAGDRIVYARGNDVVEVAIETSVPPVLGRPQLLFTRPALGFQLAFGWDPDFTMSGDGDRFYYFEPAADEAVRPTMVLYQNWIRAFEE
jgi:Tol biopolymer transport system component